MRKGSWKVGDKDEAIYIDIDEDEKDDDDKKIYSLWSELPDLILEQIFSYLTMRQKFYASLVCKNWNRAFYLQNVWAHFILADSTLTRGRFNYYSGWQVFSIASRFVRRLQENSKMRKGSWKVGDKDEAIYIDIDEDEKDDDDKKIYSLWSELPDLILEQIFSYLTMRQKFYASLVCKNWNRAFYLQNVWAHFILADSTLTRGRFNYYSGWQYVLDHLRTQLCLTQIGKNIRHLTFEPMLNFYNLYEFMNMISWFIEQARSKQEDEFGVGCNIRSLKFTFPCDMSNRDETERIRLFGTGGKLLAALKRLMGNLKKLKRLELIDLMLHPEEAQHLLDEVCDTVSLTLRFLSIINTTKVPCQILHVGVLLNLQVLEISPQNLGDEMIELIGFTKLRHLHIIQNRYSPSDQNVVGVSPKTWQICRKNNSSLNVHLEVRSTKEKILIWQEGAPVKSILFNSPKIGIQSNVILNAIDLYRNDLRIFGHQNIPRLHRSKSFKDRVDQLLVLLCKECQHLQTLVVTERISTCTVLLIAHTAKNLQNLFIRKNAVIKKCDWPTNLEWSTDFVDWIKINSKSYDAVETEVSNIIGCNWRMLRDKEFQNLHINLHSSSITSF